MFLLLNYNTKNSRKVNVRIIPSLDNTLLLARGSKEYNIKRN